MICCFWSVAFINKYCVGAVISDFMSISDKLGPNFFRRKMEQTRLVSEEMDEMVFVSRQNRYLFF